MPAELLLLETDCPYLSPRAAPRPAQPARATCSRRCARSRPMRGDGAGALEAQVEAQRRARLLAAVSAPRQVTLARLAELGIRPDRDLGQHFLIDDNLLGVIGRLAALGRGDVALEVGAGLGVLTACLAGGCAHVHAVEIDRRLERRCCARSRASAT